MVAVVGVEGGQREREKRGKAKETFPSSSSPLSLLSLSLPPPLLRARIPHTVCNLEAVSSILTGVAPFFCLFLGGGG